MEIKFVYGHLSDLLHGEYSRQRKFVECDRSLWR